MARLSRQFICKLEKLLERLAVRTEDGKLIYQDISCMSWAAVCDPITSTKEDGNVYPDRSPLK
jgi:hypothetical protein